MLGCYAVAEGGKPIGSWNLVYFPGWKCARGNLSVLYGLDGIVSPAVERELITKMYNTGDYVVFFLRGDRFYLACRFNVFTFKRCGLLGSVAPWK